VAWPASSESERKTAPLVIGREEGEGEGDGEEEEEDEPECVECKFGDDVDDVNCLASTDWRPGPGGLDEAGGCGGRGLGAPDAMSADVTECQLLAPEERLVFPSSPSGMSWRTGGGGEVIDVDDDLDFFFRGRDMPRASLAHARVPPAFTRARLKIKNNKLYMRMHTRVGIYMVELERKKACASENKPMPTS